MCSVYKITERLLHFFIEIRFVFIYINILWSSIFKTLSKYRVNVMSILMMSYTVKKYMYYIIKKVHFLKHKRVQKVFYLDFVLLVSTAATYML